MKLYQTTLPGRRRHSLNVTTARATDSITTRSPVRSKSSARARKSTDFRREALATSSSDRIGEDQLSEALKRDGLPELEMDMGVCDVMIRYTPEAVRAKMLQTPGDAVALVARGVSVVSKCAKFAGSLVYDDLVNEGDSPETVKYRAKQLRTLLTDLGPSFIKLGQVLANRPDILREDFMQELCQLQDDVPSFPNEEAFKIIEEELGRPLTEVFSEVSKEPVAAASLGQVYRATLRSNGEEVAIKVQRPGVEPVIYRDLILFRWFAQFLNAYSVKRLGTNAQLIVDEFGQKLLEELDYVQEERNIQEFYNNFKDDPFVKIPKAYTELCSGRVLVMEWVKGVRCTDPQGIVDAGIDVDEFIRVGVVSGLRQLLEFGLFHGDPHPGNVFAMQDGRIAYVDFGNVAQLSSQNKQTLIDAVVHAVNEDYTGMAGDFIRLGFLTQGTDVTPIVPALEAIWTDCRGQSLSEFNFRTVTDRFNRLVYRYPVRIPERYALVIRSLLTQEGICMTLQPDFKFLEVAFPYIAKRLLTDEDPALRERLLQVLFNEGKFQWERLENLLELAQDVPTGGNGKLDLSDSVVDGAKLLLVDDNIRNQLLMALTEDDRLHVSEVQRVASKMQDNIEPEKIVREVLTQGPAFIRQSLLKWSDNVLAK